METQEWSPEKQMEVLAAYAERAIESADVDKLTIATVAAMTYEAMHGSPDVHGPVVVARPLLEKLAPALRASAAKAGLSGDDLSNFIMHLSDHGTEALEIALGVAGEN